MQALPVLEVKLYGVKGAISLMQMGTRWEVGLQYAVSTKTSLFGVHGNIPHVQVLLAIGNRIEYDNDAAEV